MVARAGASIVVMAGGKVRAHNVREIVRRTGVREVHAWLTESPDAVGELVRELAERRV
jgi:copper homeostasis protein CutC